MFNYTKLEPEPPLKQKTDKELEGKWPNKGAIEFKNVKFKYRKDLDLTLKGIDMNIKPG